MGPQPRLPLATHVRGLVAHLAFGLAVATTVEAGSALLQRRPERVLRTASLLLSEAATEPTGVVRI